VILSIIIVNYRVRYFLELCLHSAEKALSGLDAEIIVIDNHSGDGSVEALQPQFPRVKFLLSPTNEGFAKANNLALQQAKGQNILFLNPDTILPEDLPRICLDFLVGKPNAGGVGFRMIDGSGRFLHESRRGFPTPWVAFCKLSGLSALFPRSRFFAAYYLGHLPARTSHPAPVLSGACLWVSRAILEKIGGFDERFFMYAEDIDLSYRIEQAGYLNYYLADTTIIHFKGESTQKDIRYVRQFYKAMSQFRRKHFRRGLPKLFNAVMEAGIWIRAGFRSVAIPVPPSKFTSHPRYYPTGDPQEANRTKEALTRAGLTLAENRETATDILFCEGKSFTFRECISALETAALYRTGQQARFHAAGSHSATGSPDRNGRGETLVF
jgi:GT2 family glycosyltransferase